MSLTEHEVQLVRSTFGQVRALQQSMNQVRQKVDLLSEKIGHGIGATDAVRQGEARAALSDLLRIGCELTGSDFDQPKHIDNDTSLPLKYRVSLWYKPWMVDRHGRCHQAEFIAIEASSNRQFAPARDYWHRI